MPNNQATLTLIKGRIWRELKSESNQTPYTQRQFEILSMKNDEIVKAYVTRAMTIVIQIWFTREVFHDSRVMEKITVDKFEAKIWAIEETCNLVTSTVAELVSKLQTHEHQRFIHISKKYSKNFGEFKEAYTAKSKGTLRASNGKNHSHKYYNRTNHMEKNCSYKDKKVTMRNFYKKEG